MKNLKSLVMLLLAGSLVFVSCKKDEPAGVAEGKMTSTVDGKSVTFNVAAISYKGTSGSQQYEYLVVTGSNGTSAADVTSFAVTVYSSKLEAKTYTVPTYSATYNYDYLKGFAAGYYFKAANTQDYYSSLQVENASGTVTVESISTTNVKGSYDMKLANSLDKTKTMTLKGSFNAKIMNVGSY